MRFPALDLRWRPAADAPALCELLHATLDAFDPQAIHDYESAGWRVFFRTSAQRDLAAAAIQSAFAAQLDRIESVDVPDDDWARRSQSDLKAIRVGRIVVAPPWDAVSLTEPDLLIVIDPSTGFGTGHHETTRLCLQLLQELDLERWRAIDVGTGSGVLAIAAWMLGATGVVAFDEDPEALRNARENVARNRASGAIDVREADIASESYRVTPAAVVMANLTAAVLSKHAARLIGLVEPGGWLLVSGFNRDEFGDVASRFPDPPAQHAFEGDWGAALFRLTDHTQS
jgi:ribosomal protein L11 methyltransferase